MADKKISALPAASTPLAGTEVLPIVQGGTTDQVSVANLTAGRAMSAAQLTLSTENLIIGTAGKGIDFSANTHAAGMTSELLNDYEEGIWTPVPVPAAGSITSFTSEGYYTKVGRQVTVQFTINITNVGTGVTLDSITGLPFANNYTLAAGCGSERGVTGSMWQYLAQAGAAALKGYDYANNPTLATGYVLYGTVTYFN